MVSDPASADPVVARLFRYRTSLKAGGSCAGYDVLATYQVRSGHVPFAICRDGLLIDPTANPRFIAFAEIEDAGYHDAENVRRAKRAKAFGPGNSEPLSIRLRSGEKIDLPMEVRDDGMPDLLTIAKFIHQRSVIARSEQLRRSRPSTPPVASQQEPRHSREGGNS
jgi:hypothetical protein